MEDVEWGKYLVQSFVVPVRVDLSKLEDNTVVLTNKDNVSDSQDELLIDTGIAGQEAVDVGLRASAPFVRVSGLEWQQVLEPVLLENGQSFQEASLVRPERVDDVVRRAVHEVRVEHARHSAELQPWPCHSGEKNERKKKRISPAKKEPQS